MSIELLLYLAGVVGSLESVLALFLVLVLCFGVAFTICAVAEKGECLDASDTYKKRTTERYDHYYTAAKRCWLAVAIAVFIGVFTPSQKTILMMAAAHYGKEAIASEMGQKVQRILESKLDELLAGEKK